MCLHRMRFIQFFFFATTGRFFWMGRWNFLSDSPAPENLFVPPTVQFSVRSPKPLKMFFQQKKNKLADSQVQTSASQQMAPLATGVGGSAAVRRRHLSVPKVEEFQDFFLMSNFPVVNSRKSHRGDLRVTWRGKNKKTGIVAAFSVWSNTNVHFIKKKQIFSWNAATERRCPMKRKQKKKRGACA